MTSEKRIKLAILDDYANTAPSKFDSLSSKLEIHSFPETLNTKTEEGRSNLISRLKDFTIISTMRERTAFTKEILSALPNLKLLLTTGTKNASIDVEACKDLGVIYVGTTPPPGSLSGYSQTNEHCWALILGLAKNMSEDDLRLKSDPKGWQSGLTFGLAGKTLAVLGLGRLGGQAALTGKLGFGMNVICWSSSLTQEKADDISKKMGLSKGDFHVVENKLDLFKKADILTVQYVLSERSKGIVSEKELDVMKKTALLVNTSRGPLIDEDSLLKTLREGKIAGVALDVYDLEPLPEDSPWRKEKWGQDGKSQVLLSPHMGYVEERTMHSWYEQHAANVKRWLDGEDVLTKMY